MKWKYFEYLTDKVIINVMTIVVTLFGLLLGVYFYLHDIPYVSTRTGTQLEKRIELLELKMHMKEEGNVY